MLSLSFLRSALLSCSGALCVLWCGAPAHHPSCAVRKSTFPLMLCLLLPSSFVMTHPPLHVVLQPYCFPCPVAHRVRNYIPSVLLPSGAVVFVPPCVVFALLRSCCGLSSLVLCRSVSLLGLAVLPSCAVPFLLRSVHLLRCVVPLCGGLLVHVRYVCVCVRMLVFVCLFVSVRVSVCVSPHVVSAHCFANDLARYKIKVFKCAMKRQ